MRKYALFAMAVVLPISVWAQTSGAPIAAPNAAPGTVLTGEDSIIPAHTPIAVRIKEAITAATDDDRMYSATIEGDVTDTKGRVMIPKGSDARVLIQRIGTDLSLDLASVTVDDQTYALIAGEATARGSRVSVPANAVLTFRLDNPVMLLTPVK